MNSAKPPFKKYPGNKQFSQIVERSGTSSTVPLIHGVVRGALANPFDVDPGKAMGEVFVDAHLEKFSQATLGVKAQILRFLVL